MSKTIEERLTDIEKRNMRVESDKAWETSWTRRVSIFVLTYIVIAAYLIIVVHIDPWINALVPAIGFFLSTLTISFLKKQWQMKRARRTK